MINMKVKHKAFGDGIVISIEDSYILIEFPQGVKKFAYPDAFDGYLTVEDEDINQCIQQEIENIKKIEKEKLENLERQKQIQRKNKEKHIKVKKKMDARANIAFKCNFCDGGQTDEQVGFNGVCSDEIIHNNILIEKRTWCSSDDCQCGQYLKGNTSRSELEDVNDNDLLCYESQMLRDWKALAGIVQRGKRKGEFMKLNKVQNNSLCVLTTRDPKTTERERYIFAVFLVDETYEGDNREAGYVTTESKYRIKLSSKEAHKMLFWNYHANNNRPEVALWSSGLHRYFEDEQAIQILKDIAKLKQGTKQEKLSREFLHHFAKINGLDIRDVPEKNGALTR